MPEDIKFCTCCSGSSEAGGDLFCTCDDKFENECNEADDRHGEVTDNEW